MELKGKKIAFLGDSITDGTGVSSIEKTYWNIIGQKTGAEVYGYGFGGTRIAVNHTPSSDGYMRKVGVDENWFGARVEKMIPDADIVVIFGGTNDFGHGDAPIGTMNDRTNDTFYGAYHLLIQQLISRYPYAQLVVMTPLHRSSEDDMPFNDFGVRRQGNLKCYVNAIREVAEFYGVPVCDQFAESGLQPRVKLIQEMFVPDGLHPNDAGHIKIAECLLRTLNRL